MTKKKLGFVIYRVSWEVYDDEGCYEVFYTDWHLDKKIVISHKRELIELSKVRKDIHFNEIEQEFVSCTEEKIQDIRFNSSSILKVLN